MSSTKSYLVHVNVLSANGEFVEQKTYDFSSGGHTVANLAENVFDEFCQGIDVSFECFRVFDGKYDPENPLLSTALLRQDQIYALMVNTRLEDTSPTVNSSSAQPLHQSNVVSKGPSTSIYKFNVFHLDTFSLFQYFYRQRG